MNNPKCPTCGFVFPWREALKQILGPSRRTTALWGALFGFFTYATYDLTNMATIRGWPLAMVVVDILWGTLLCTLVAAGSFYAGRWLMG